MRRSTVRRHSRRTKHGRTTVGAHLRNRTASEFEVGPRRTPTFPAPRNLTVRKARVAQAAKIVRSRTGYPVSQVLVREALAEDMEPEAYAQALLTGEKDAYDESTRVLKLYLRAVEQLHEAEGRRQGRLFDPGPQGSRSHIVDPMKAMEFDRKFKQGEGRWVPHPFVESMRKFDTYKAMEERKRAKKAEEKRNADPVGNAYGDSFRRPDIALPKPTSPVDLSHIPAMPREGYGQAEHRPPARHRKSLNDLSPSINDVIPGQHYWTMVGDDLQEVEVVRVQLGHGTGGRRVVIVRNVRTGEVLPKARTAAALRRSPEKHFY